MFVFISINNSPGAWWIGPLTLLLSLSAQYGWGPSWQSVREWTRCSSTSGRSSTTGYRIGPGAAAAAGKHQELMMSCML
jgi:hypothetical protein